jgi:hypothetical protein
MPIRRTTMFSCDPATTSMLVPPTKIEDFTMTSISPAV